MCKIGTFRKRSGQALLEWIVFGAFGLIVWAIVLNFAKKTLDHTLAGSLSIFAARKALSNEPFLMHESRKPIQLRDTQLIQQLRDNPTTGRAIVTIGKERVTAVIQLPAQSRLRLPFSGFRFSRF